MKIVIPSKLIVLHTRLEVLLGLNLSGHTNILAEASNVLNEFYQGGEIENEQQHRNALDNFYTN